MSPAASQLPNKGIPLPEAVSTSKPSLKSLFNIERGGLFAHLAHLFIKDASFQNQQEKNDIKF